MLSRILVTSPRYGAPQRGPGLSGNFDSSAFAQLVGAADALARGVHPSGKRAPLDGHVYPGHAVPSRQSPGCAAIPRGRKFRSASIAWRACWSRSWRLAPSRVVAFEPDGETFTQYFFLGRDDFAAAGLRSEVAAAILTRLEELDGECSDCGRPAILALDFAAGSFQPRPDGADPSFARRALLREARRREIVRSAGKNRRGESVLHQCALWRFRAHTSGFEAMNSARNCREISGHCGRLCVSCAACGFWPGTQRSRTHFRRARRGLPHQPLLSFQPGFRTRLQSTDSSRRTSRSTRKFNLFCKVLVAQASACGV